MNLRIIRAIIPQKTRRFMRNLLRRFERAKLRRKFFQWSASLSQAKRDEYAAEITYVREHGISIFPYIWAGKFAESFIKVSINQEGHPFIVRNGLNIYFPATWSKERTREYYIQLLIEQSSESPHAYSTLGQTIVGRKGLLVDIGSAEGIWAFDNAAFAKEIILCEPNREWESALKKTFLQFDCPFSVLIKMVGIHDDVNSITVDTLLTERDGDAIAIKVDVEGNERQVLAGADATIRRKSITTWDICIYHNPDDEEIIQAIFTKSCTHLRSMVVNPGFMVFTDEKPPRHSFLRRGVVRIIHECLA